MNYQDKLGVYRVGDLKFYSKLEAIEMHAKTGIHPHWDFNEAVFNSYDWTQEPSTCILELYRQRAQQLRDKYDYIVLFYSGGADSHTALQAFVDNDIKLDEVASMVNMDATGDTESTLNTEIFQVAIPYIEQLKNRCPWLLHRLIEISEINLSFINSDANKFDWLYSVNNFYCPNSMRESMPLKIKEWADLINQGKKVCVLYGHDKPRVWHINGKFVVRFLDFIDSGPTVKSIAGQQPYTDELFYWTPDLPEIVIKQAHLIKNYLNFPNVKDLPFVSTVKSDLCYKEIDGAKYWLSNHGIHSLIYPKWNTNVFSIGKPASIIISPRDRWFFELGDEVKAKQRWTSGIEKLSQMLPQYWKNNPDNFSQGLRGCWSIDYNIGD